MIRVVVGDEVDDVLGVVVSVTVTVEVGELVRLVVGVVPTGENHDNIRRIIHARTCRMNVSTMQRAKDDGNLTFT